MSRASWLGASALALAGCGGVLPWAPGPSLTLRLEAAGLQSATPGLLSVITPYAAGDLAHLVVTLAELAAPATETVVASLDVAGPISFPKSLTFDHLKYQQPYRVRARGYLQAGTGADDLITDDALSVAGFSTQDTGTVDVGAALMVVLKARPFNGTARFGAVAVTDGLAYAAAQIQRIVLTAYDAAAPAVAVTSTTLTAGAWQAPVALANLAAGHTYTVRAVAYDAGNAVISTDDARSATDVAIADDTAPALGALKVRLLDAPAGYRLRLPAGGAP